MPEITKSKARIDATWDDVPHLSREAKEELLSSYAPHMREARSRGIPVLGSGAIYPIPIQDLWFTPFQFPAYWPRVYGMDVGWKRTAVVWGALDRDQDVVYLYAEHYLGQAVPALHAAAIKARGEWIPGVIDPAARGRSQVDGTQIIVEYRKHGLKLTPADNSVEAGLQAIWDRASTGRLKVGRNMTHFATEWATYHRDENGKIVKKMDHLMDAARYLVMSGLRIAKVQAMSVDITAGSHRAADSIAGY